MISLKKISIINLIFLLFLSFSADGMINKDVSFSYELGDTYKINSLARDELYFARLHEQEIDNFHYIIGKNFQRAQLPQKSLFNLKRFITENPQSELSHDAKFHMAEILFQRKDFRQARDIFIEIIQECRDTENTVPAAIYAGKASFELKEYWYSATYFKSAISYKKLNSDTKFLLYYWLGLSYYLLAEYNDALAAFQNVSHDSQYAMEAMYFSGKCHFLLGNFEEGIYVLELLSKQSSENRLASEVDYLVGTSQVEIGQYEKAIESFIRALAKDPHFLVAENRRLEFDYFSEKEVNWWIDDCLYLLQWCYFLSEKHEETFQIHSLFQNHFTDSPFFVASLLIAGDLELKQQSYEQARQYYEVIVQEYPQDDLVDDTFFRLGWCYYQEDDHYNAINNWGKLLASFPGNFFVEETILLIGEVEYKNGKYNNARDNFKSLIINYPFSEYIDDALYGIAWSFYNENLCDSATQYYEHIIQEQPDSPLVANSYYRGGKCLHRLENYQQAIDYFQNFLKIEPQSDSADDALYFLAKSYELLLDKDKALSEYSTLVNRYSESRLAPYAQFAIADLYFADEDYKKAIENYTKLENWVDNEKLLDDARYQIERCFYLQGKYRSPLSISLNFVKKYPESPRSPQLLLDTGDYYSYKGDYQKAKYYFKQIIRDFPERAEFYDAYFKLADVYIKTNDLDQAIETYNSIISLSESDKESAKAQYLMADILLKQKNYSDAINQHLNVVTYFPNSSFAPKSLLRIGNIYLLLQRWSEAKGIFEIITTDYKDSKENGEAMLGIAKSLLLERSIEEAIEEANRIVETQPDELKVEALMLIGECHFSLENYENSVKTFKNVYQNYKEYSDKAYSAMYNAGLALEHLGHWDEAAALYEKIIKNPTNMQNFHEATTRLQVIQNKLSQKP